MDTLGDRIKYLRGDKSQRWLADKLSIPQTTLSNYENNKSELNFAMIETLTTIFRVNTDWLLFGRGPMKPGATVEAPPQEGKQDERVRELERQLAETKEELIRAYRLATENLRPLAEDIQRIIPAVEAAMQNQRIDKKEDQEKQAGK